MSPLDYTLANTCNYKTVIFQNPVYETIFAHFNCALNFENKLWGEAMFEILKLITQIMNNNSNLDSYFNGGDC